MEKLVVLLLPILMLLSCQSETSKKKDKIKEEWQKYEQAMHVEDYSSAAFYVQNIVALDSNESSHYDTLAKLYSLMGNPQSAFLSAQKAMKYEVHRSTAKIAYESLKEAGKESFLIQYGEILLSYSQDSIPLLYELAVYHKNGYNYEQARIYLEKIVQNPESFTINDGKMDGSTNDGPQIIYRSAALNLLGFVYSELGDPQKAQEMFTAALSFQQSYNQSKQK